MNNSSKYYLINTKEYLDLEVSPKVNKDNLKKSQIIMTEMLKSFDKICRKYNLKYWCVGGTFIGAIRHHGWIPYDGDVDVCMLDTDYKIFLSKANELSSNLWLQFKDNDPLYKINIRKIRHLYSYYTDYAPRDSHTGLQIDIFLYKQVDDKLICLSDKYHQCAGVGDLKYSEIFPLSVGKFEDIDVYLPNNYKDYSIKYWKNYPPVLFPIEKRYPHEGNMNPNNAREEDLKLYPIIYNSLKEWKILIISISQIKERRTNVLNLIEKFKKLNINAEIIEAYYWKVHNIEESLKENNINTTINYNSSNKIKGQICCFLSHMKAWKHIANASPDINYIILEDDMDIPEDFNFEYLTNIFKYIPNYDFVSFWRHPAYIIYQSRCIYNQFVSKFYNNYGICSYTITKTFANEIIKINKYYTAVDDVLNNDYLRNRKTFITLKDYFINEGGIGAFRQAKKSKFLSSIQY